MSIAEAIAYLDRYKAWRTGVDDRTLDEAGLTPRVITEAMDVVLAFAKECAAGKTS